MSTAVCERKRGYLTAEAASAAAAEFTTRPGTRPLEPYDCPDCPQWHLRTARLSKPARRRARFVAMGGMDMTVARGARMMAVDKRTIQRWKADYRAGGQR